MDTYLPCTETKLKVGPYFGCSFYLFVISIITKNLPTLTSHNCDPFYCFLGSIKNLKRTSFLNVFIVLNKSLDKFGRSVETNALCFMGFSAWLLTSSSPRIGNTPFKYYKTLYKVLSFINSVSGPSLEHIHRLFPNTISEQVYCFKDELKSIMCTFGLGIPYREYADFPRENWIRMQKLSL